MADGSLVDRGHTRDQEEDALVLPIPKDKMTD